MNAKINVPTLRFSEFSGEWEVKTLGNLIQSLNAGISVNSGDRPANLNEKAILKTSCVSSGVFDITENKVVLDDVEIQRLKEPVTANSIIISRMNTPVLVGANSFVKYDNLNTFLPDRLWAAKIRKDASPLWTSILMSSSKIRALLSTRATGTSNSMKNITKGDVLTLPIVAPSKPEQEKIASFLSSVDTRIEQLTKKKTLLVQYKKGVMQKIFSQEIRFKDDDGSEYPEWEEKKLEEICKIAKSGGTPTSTKKEYYDGDIPFLSISDMTNQGKYLHYTSNHISEIGLQNSSSWIVPKNCIIYSMYASVGFVAINKIPLATSQAVLNLVLKEEVNLEFVYYKLVDFQKKVATFITTGTQGNLNAQTVKNFLIHTPSFQEQTKIANFLSSLDLKTSHLEKELELSKKFKKALLQQMFV